MIPQFRRAALLVLTVAIALFAPRAGRAQDTAAPTGDPGWPRVFTSGGDTITVYQPQLDSWAGDALAARMAISILPAGAKDPLYGTATFKALTVVDKTNRVVYLENMTFSDVTFPSSPNRVGEFIAAVQSQVPTVSKAISLDRLEADLAIVNAQRKSESQPLQNQPPKILFSSVPALLVVVQGAPVWKPMSKSKLQHLVNTSPIIFQAQDGTIFLHVFDGWMQTVALEGSWSVATNIPSSTKKDLDNSMNTLVQAGQGDPLTGALAAPGSTAPKPSLSQQPVPVIYVATTPTELIVTEGAPDYVPITGTSLLYVSNTSGRVFKDIGNQLSYILLGGRWFSASSLDGPWTYVPGTGLPPDFAQIPDDSPMENVKACVPGTPQAQEAAIEAGIPEIATVDIAQTKAAPITFDGQPKMEPISGTSLQYVTNATTPVIMVTPTSWYACQNAIWFTSTSVNGPWTVATAVPAAIYTIPPSSSVYYVTYVYIYSVTPTVIYEGYLPGYTGAIITPSGVVVYGTGYTYTAWVGTVYYPPPTTYGYNVNMGWNPAYGWAFIAGYGCAVAWGGYACYPYPAYGYAHPYYGYGGTVYGPYGGYASSTGVHYTQNGSVGTYSRSGSGYNPYTGNSWSGTEARSYNSTTGVASAGQHGTVSNAYTGNYATGGRGYATNTYTGTTAAGSHYTTGNAYTGQSTTQTHGEVYNPNTGQATSVNAAHNQSGQGVAKVGNNTYAANNGTVYKNTGSGWQENSGSGWNDVNDQNKTQSYNNQAQARSSGDDRSQGYQQSGGGGGWGGGGGGRRR
jgi:hypothetical protein